MRNITFDFLGQHNHGTAFRDYLQLRKRFFVDELGWDLPHNNEVDMDQYDNPCAHYSLVLRDGEIIGDARTMSTATSWGESTYMLRDAVRGYLKDIPSDVVPKEIAANEVWECTRLVISENVRGHRDRADCLSLIVEGLADVAHSEGASRLVSLSPLPLMRALRQLGYAADRIGEAYVNATDGRRYAVLQMPTHREIDLPMAA